MSDSHADQDNRSLLSAAPELGQRLGAEMRRGKDYMPEQRATVIVVCRNARPWEVLPEPLRRCPCEVLLAPTPDGQRRIAAGGIAVCVSCGHRFAQTAAEVGTLETILSPQAEATAASGSANCESMALYKLCKKHPLKDIK